MEPKVILLANNCFVDERCVMCGEPFEGGEILPELYDDGDFMGYLCDDCAYEPQNYASRIEEWAKRLESQAAWVRHLADRGIQPPDATDRLMLESLILVGDSERINEYNNNRISNGK